jgi:hypothetical protein
MNQKKKQYRQANHMNLSATCVCINNPTNSFYMIMHQGNFMLFYGDAAKSLIIL